ncbi:MAG: hypothetical protein Q7S83_02015 [bacterium]|nr:hypothetical protein [bacterium]
MNIDWYGNDGSCNPLPGTMATATCGVCGSPMNVERNVLAPTGLAEAMSGNKHLHDRFTRPNKTRDWHAEINRLLMAIYIKEIDALVSFEKINLEELRKDAAKKILEILNANGIK